MSDYKKRENALNILCGDCLKEKVQCGDDCITARQIKDLPSADVAEQSEIDSIVQTVVALERMGNKRKRGEWQKKEKRGAMTTHTEYHCSECQTIMGAIWNYCPNCGADMRGVENEID